MSNSARNLIFTDQDYYRLFPNGIPTKKYQPRQLYPHEIRALKVILRNPLLENALRNEFGKRALTKTEINTLKVILRTHTNRAPVIEKIFEETLASIINPAPEEIVETQLITETETRPCITFEENQKKRVQATEAYHKRSNIYGQQLQEQEYYDEDEEFRSINHRSNYSNRCTVDNCNGDIDVNRFWFDSYCTDIDKTNSLNSTYELYKYVDTTQFDSFHYQLDKSGYQEIVTHLTPEATEREYGRVFFSTETQYSPLYYISYRFTPHEIRGYSIRKNRKIYGPRYVKPRKSILYHSNDDGSILKKPTVQGNIINRFLRYIDSVRNDNDHIPARNINIDPNRRYPNQRTGSFSTYRYPRTFPFTQNRNPSPEPLLINLQPPLGPSREGYIAQTLYREIKRQILLHDYITWVNHSTSTTYRYNFFPNRTHELSPWRSDLSDYYNKIRDLNNHIDYVIQTNFRCRYSIKKIQRKLRERTQIKHKRYIDKLRNLGKPTSKPTLTPTGEPSGSGQV